MQQTITQSEKGKKSDTCYNMDKCGRHFVSEIRQTQKDKYCMTPFIQVLKQSNSQGQKVERWLSGVGGEENGELSCQGYDVSAWNDEKVLEMDSGDGCVTMQSIENI